MNFVLVKKRPKSTEITHLSNVNRNSSVYHKDLICRVCEAPATGFNFAVITCMCCKAFFRRNALFGIQSLQCRYLSENCIITMKTRRDCSYCRLKKCFQVGMKKELILTEELKRLKREKILENRQITLNISHSIDTYDMKENFLLKTIDFDCITNICNAYEECCRLPLISFEKHEYELLRQQPIKSRIKLQHYFRYYKEHETLLINFFQNLPEFNQFSNDQQLALSKHNIRFLIRISLIETINDQLPLWPAINLLLEIIFGKSLVEEANSLLHKFKDKINDSTCIRLLLIILLFSTYDTYNGHTDTLCIYKTQEKYTNLLWFYLIKHYGELTAYKKISIVTYYCLHLLTLSHLAELKKQEIQWQTFFLSLE
ncbi:unnamed protein product [Rotaria sp. Silwood2]|nr:unnamed protein product [Rotaria sp. Silwood2]CAF2891613.1 unnamed protein product [Rotaria sp. Silwood2]CAF4190368.1 unnamed protein product [Rotaria sp. Silwood2]CAF4362811.1 unnamed protein product [Rotaria sp. Silwood2]